MLGILKEIEKMERLGIKEEIMPTVRYRRERRNAMLETVSSTERKENEKQKQKTEKTHKFLFKVGTEMINTKKRFFCFL